MVDEYGGTAGLVTMEDLLESIVGNIQDEYDHEAEEISPMGENQYSIAGTATLDEVGRLLGLEFDDEEDDYDTLGGYIVGKLGHIPAAGDSPTVLVGSVEFTVTEVQEHRIERVRAVVHKAKPQAVSA